MSKKTNHQRLIEQGQPYTKVMSLHVPKVVPSLDDGPQVVVMIEFQILGYTLEEKFENEEWTTKWEEHDLGRAGSLAQANELAKSWRESLVGEYVLR